MRCTVACVLALAGILVSVGRAANPLGVVAPSNSDAASFAQRLGVRYARVNWSWSDIEANKGYVETAAADRNYTAAWQTGIRLVPVYSVGPNPWISGRDTSKPAARSYPPKDLSTTWQTGYGYSASFHTFTSILFYRYRGGLDWVAFESEPELASSWGGTADEYLRTLATARKAIREADSRTRIIAGGFSSDTLGLLIAKDWIETGVRTRDEALAFAREYYRSGGAASPAAAALSQPGAIETALDDPGSTFNTEIWPRANTILDGIGPLAEAVDFHFYASARWLPLVAGWFRARGTRAKPAYNLPVASTELGVRGVVQQGCAVDPAELDRLSRETFKTVVTAWTAGLEVALLSSAEGECRAGFEGPVSLFNSDGSYRPAGDGVRAILNVLKNSQGLDRVVREGPAQYRYVFRNWKKEPAIVAAWSETGQSAIGVTVSGDAPPSAWDYAGRSLPVTRNGDRIEASADGPLIASLPPVEFRFATVSSAGYTPAVAPDSIASGFGEDLRTEPLSALAQTWVTVLDSAGIERDARVFYAGPSQVNFQIPGGTAPGNARIRAGRGDVVVATSTANVQPVAPGLYSANGDGKGVAAANLLRIRPDGGAADEPFLQAGPGGRWVAAPVDANAGPLIAVLYGTGIRRAAGDVTASVGGVPAAVEFAGPHPQYYGLDQVNVRIPGGMAGRGEVEVKVTAGGVASNAVTFAFR